MRSLLAHLLLATSLAGCLGEDKIADILDHDDDGYQDADAEGDDCDDNDPAIHPGAAEVCGDEVDNDCDGRVDDAGEGDREVWFDGDGDSLGDPDRGERACTAGPDQVTNGDDCDDANAGVGGRSLWFDDGDGDGVGTGAAALTCPGPGLVATGGDCDDTDPAVGAGTPELLFPDGDGDGVGSGSAVEACPQPGFVPDDGDCDDADASVGAPSKLYTDADLDGFGAGQPQITCPADGLSPVGTDCDDTRPDILDVVPTLLHADLDGDNYGGGDALLVCPQPGWVPRGGDCDEASVDVNPGEIEVTCTGVDDDCDAGTPDGPVYDATGAYASIQEGLDLGTGDLTVCDGDYFEELVVARSVAIAPEPGAVVEIHPTGGPALRVDSGGPLGVTVTGITLRGGEGFVIPFPDGRHVGGTVVSLDPATPLTLVDCVVEDGDADYGGNIATFGPLTLTDTLVSGGEVDGDGGCIWAAADVALLGTTTVTDCKADGNGGGIWISRDGASVDLDADDTIVISANEAVAGGGIWADEGSEVELGVETRIYDNTATGAGGGAWMEGSFWSGGVLEGNDSTGDGGGMLLAGGTISGVRFVANTAQSSGGALSGFGVIDVSTFEANSSFTGGGGAVHGTARLDIDTSSFDGNTAYSGSGGAIWSESSLFVADGVFSGNVAQSSEGGAIRGEEVTISGISTFTGNTAGTNGGAVSVGGGLHSLTLFGVSTWSGNSAAAGGAIHHLGERSEVDQLLPFVDGSGATFSGNSATEGGAVWLDGVWLNEGTFTGNVATNGGAVRAGGAYLTGGVFTGNSASARGGAIYASNATIESAAISVNDAAFGGGVANDPGSWVLLADAELIANIAALDGGAVHITGGAPHDEAIHAYLMVDGGLLQGNTARSGGAVWLGGADLYIGVDTGGAATGPVTFTGNASTSDGGALFTQGACSEHAFGCDSDLDLWMEGGSFSSNTAGGDGAGWWTDETIAPDLTIWDSNIADGQGGAVFLSSTLGYFDVCDFNNNTADNGGAIAVTSLGYLDATLSSVCKRCDFLNNDASVGQGGNLFLDGTPTGTGRFDFQLATFDPSSTPYHVETLSALGVVHVFSAGGFVDVECTARDGCN